MTELTIAALEAKVAEHAPSATYRQCRCGHVPAEDCWQRATWQKMLDDLRAQLAAFEPQC